MSQRVVYFNGDFIPEQEARISIFDSALMFGDMVFEMTRSFNLGRNVKNAPETLSEAFLSFLQVKPTYLTSSILRVCKNVPACIRTK